MCLFVALCLQLFGHVTEPWLAGTLAWKTPSNSDAIERRYSAKNMQSIWIIFLITLLVCTTSQGWRCKNATHSQQDQEPVCQRAECAIVRGEKSLRGIQSHNTTKFRGLFSGQDLTLAESAPLSINSAVTGDRRGAQEYTHGSPADAQLYRDQVSLARRIKA